MKWNSKLEHIYDRSLGLLKSTAVAYLVGPTGHIEPEMVSFLLGDGDIIRTDVRAHRQQLKRRGENVPELSAGAIKHGLIVLLGPDTGPRKAILALRKLADLIEKEGLIIGYDDEKSPLSDGYWEYERASKNVNV
jgi:hypothetical protein